MLQENMYKKKYMLGIVVFCTILLMAMISAQPPVTTVQQFQEGFIIVESPHDFLKLNEDYQYNFFVYNQSNGVLMDNSSITCNFILANISGEIILNQEVNYFSDSHWGIDILGGNFSYSGGYPYGVSCQDSYGGALSGFFQVTESGVELTEGRSLLVIGLLTLLVFLLFISLYSLFNMENYIGKFALYWVSHILMILISFVAWQIAVDGLLGGVALIGIFRIMFWIFTISVLPMIILSGAWIFYIHAFNEHFEKLIDKGVNTEEAFRMTNKKRGGWFNGR
jgi:hypothetical protein